jgi:hypothetical protein
VVYLRKRSEPFIRSPFPEQVDEATAATTKLFGVFVPPACRAAALRLSCLGGFVSCHYDTTAHTFGCTAPLSCHERIPADSLTLDYPPCREVCDDMVSECSAFLASQGKLDQLPNCSADNPTTGQAMFPASNCNNASLGVGVILPTTPTQLFLRRP